MAEIILRFDDKSALVFEFEDTVVWEFALELQDIAPLPRDITLLDLPKGRI